MRRVSLAAVVAAALAVVVLAAGGGASARTDVNRPLLGIAGNADRFEEHTGQDSQLRHIFLGWGQGQVWGSPFRQLFAALKPLPMIHIGTDEGRTRRQAITPQGIAQGAGDAYLVALNQAIAQHGAQIYVRVMAEMNNPKNLYAPRDPSGRPRGATHTPAWYKQAFRRVYLLLHGGTKAQLDAKLRALGLPPVRSDLSVNPAPRLTVIWNPLAGLDSGPRPAEEFYPGDAYVDMVGNDIFASRPGVASHAANEALYRAHPKKPYSLPEWGLDGIDDSGFIRTICAFLKNRPRTRLAAYYESKPGSPYDIGPRRESRKAYRECITPIGAKAAAQPTLPPGPPSAAQMRLTADPPSGDAPLDVTFATEVSLGRPVVQWQLVFGDGQLRSGAGSPPATLDHTYARDGVYEAALIVYVAPPFTGTAVRFITKATVTVGSAGKDPIELIPDRTSGKAPLAVSFRARVNADVPVVRWEFLPGDGSARSGTGKPPSFLGFTYKQKGVYRAILIVYLQPGVQPAVVRLITYRDLRVT